MKAKLIVIFQDDCQDGSGDDLITAIHVKPNPSSAPTILSTTSKYSPLTPQTIGPPLQPEVYLKPIYHIRAPTQHSKANLTTDEPVIQSVPLIKPSTTTSPKPEPIETMPEKRTSGQTLILVGVIGIGLVSVVVIFAIVLFVIVRHGSDSTQKTVKTNDNQMTTLRVSAEHQKLLMNKSNNFNNCIV